ncbi:MAG: LysR family transcriptional regulator [Acetobacteraceae bacterium]|nr:LysR family transcriptional regulator [Acetobacteraceae bacterium]
MTNFDDAQLRRLDVTLLLVFEEAMASGKLSAAAKRLGLTQSAISHAIGRLREVFGDELFIRTPRGVRPTPRALTLREPLAEALRLIGGAIRPANFDPARDERVFRIAASDYETALFAPLLLSGAGASRFIFRTLIRREALDALQAGDIDLLLGYTWDKGRACEAVTLYDEDYLVVARQGHPALARPLDIGRYASHGHVLVSPGASLSGVVDEALARAGVSRRVVAAVPYFLAALATVARTDLLATVPERVARCHAPNFRLATAVPPVPVRSFPVRMVWSRRLGADPALAWVRERVREAARAAPP